MAEAVDLINAALRSVGAEAITTLDDTSPSGKIAGDVYALHRDALLRAGTWNFATGRTPLGRLVAVPTDAMFGWKYAYTLPSDWLRTVAVYDNSDGIGGDLPYKMESVFATQLLGNRDFGEDTGWTLGSGWTISGGTANHAAGSTATMSQAVAFVAGGVYRMHYTLVGVSAGSVLTSFTGGVTQSDSARSTNGVQACEITAVTGNNTFNFVPSSDFVGSVDDVYLYRVDTGKAHVVLTDAESVWLHYIRRETTVDLMTEGFRQALIFLLTKVFAAGPAASNTMRQLGDEDMRMAVRLARSIDGIEDWQEPRQMGSWALSRGAFRWSWPSTFR